MSTIDLSKAKSGDRFKTCDGRIAVYDSCDPDLSPYSHKLKINGLTMGYTSAGYFWGVNVKHQADLVEALAPAASDGPTIKELKIRLLELEVELTQAKLDEVRKRRATEANLLVMQGIGTVSGDKQTLDKLKARLESYDSAKLAANLVRRSLNASYGKFAVGRELSVLPHITEESLKIPHGWYLSQLRQRHYRPPYANARVPFEGPDGSWVAAFRRCSDGIRVEGRGRTVVQALAHARSKVVMLRSKRLSIEPDADNEFAD